MSRPWWWWLWDKDGELDECKDVLNEIKEVIDSESADYLKVQQVRKILESYK